MFMWLQQEFTKQPVQLQQEITPNRLYNHYRKVTAAGLRFTNIQETKVYKIFLHISHQYYFMLYKYLMVWWNLNHVPTRETENNDQSTSEHVYINVYTSFISKVHKNLKFSLTYNHFNCKFICFIYV